MVSSFCKDHHLGVAVPTVESRRMLTRLVHSEVTGIFHGDGLYPAGLEKHPQFFCVHAGRQLGGASVAWSHLRF
jgi:hypothetical protein